MTYINDDILAQVEKPARYTGGEWNSVVKDKNAVDIRFAFCFADVYDIGMSHLGFKLIYHMLNDRDDTWCERVFAPWPDLEEKMRESNLLLFGLESQEPIKDFDFVGFTLQYEMSYTNVINMLDLAGVPIFSKDRTDGDPIVIAGGPSANNTEVLADFIDIFSIGEGEEMLNELMDVYKEWKKSKGRRLDFLKKAARIDGIYVPCFYEVEYNEDGTVKTHKLKEEYKDSANERIVKRVVKDFENTYFPEKLVVPFVNVVHDRIMIEIFRGCTRGCRFCQAGFIYRPVRERSIERITEIANKLVKSTGYEEVSLLSLSTSDYSNLGVLCDELLANIEEKKVSLGVPSLRVDSFSLGLMEKVSRVRKSGLTFAPEAGTQRLRDVINKGVTEEDILKSSEIAFKGGWNNIKLYFMLGLPTETDEDILGIADLAHKILDVYEKVHEGKKARKPEISVSVSTFVPKPFTPFQWCAQISIDEIIRRQNLLKKALNKKIKFSWHDPETSIIEAALSRGDRRVGRVIYNAWQNGAKFDSWEEYMNYERWINAFKEEGLDIRFYTERERDLDEVLPWDHVSVGITKIFLKKELEKARMEETTPNCMVKCTGCGATMYKGGICIDKN